MKKSILTLLLGVSLIAIVASCSEKKEEEARRSTPGPGSVFLWGGYDDDGLFGSYAAENGSPVENIDVQKLREYMQWDSIMIEINLNLGSETFDCYTCDFTHDYIDINADYKNAT